MNNNIFNPNFQNKLKLCIIIGLDYVTCKEKKLKGCINDTLLIIKLLVENYDYDPNNIVLYTDLTDNKATKENIFNKFKEYIKIKDKIDTILFYFSGHGNNNSIIIDNNQTLFDYEIKTNLLYKLNPKTKFICILDCCKSGSFFRIGNWFTNYSLYDNDIKLLLISACNNNENATEFYDKKISITFGLFTYYFYEILSRYKKYNWSDLLDLLKHFVNKKNQEPQIKTINYSLDDVVDL